MELDVLDVLDTEAVENEGIIQIQMPSCELIESWVVDTDWMLDKEKGKNAWKKIGFEWVLS